MLTNNSEIKLKVHKLVYLLAGVIVLGNSVPSTAQPQKVGDRSTPTSTIAQSPSRAATQRPATKTATISIEGEKTPISLKLYSAISPRFSTYYPERYFVPESGASAEGTSARFIVNTTGRKNQEAYVHFAFMNGIKTLGQARTFVNGRRSLIASNGWQVVSRTSKVPYAWAKERIDFRQRKGNRTITGSVYMGESKGKAFYAIAHYPAEYGDGFAPRANLIFQNVQF